MADGRPTWRWFLLHAVVFGVLLFWLLGQTATDDDDGGGWPSLLIALAYCPLAGFVTTLRTNGVLDAGAVGLVTFFVGSVAALLARSVGAGDTRPLIDLLTVPGLALLGAFLAVVAGCLAQRARRPQG